MENLVVKYSPNKGIYFKERSAEGFIRGVVNDAMPFFLIYYIKAYVVVIHLNCLNKSRQFK